MMVTGAVPHLLDADVVGRIFPVVVFVVAVLVVVAVDDVVDGVVDVTVDVNFLVVVVVVVVVVVPLVNSAWRMRLLNFKLLVSLELILLYSMLYTLSISIYFYWEERTNSLPSIVSLYFYPYSTEF